MNWFFVNVEEFKKFLTKLEELKPFNVIEPQSKVLTPIERRQKIMKVLPIKKGSKIQDGQTVEEVAGTPGWLQHELGFTKDQVKKDLAYLCNKEGIKRVSVKLGKEGVPFKVNTFVYFKPQHNKESLFDKYVEEFGGEMQLLKVVDIIINLLPHKEPIFNGLKRDGKQNIYEVVKWKMKSQLDKNLVYSLIDTLVSIKILGKVTENGIRYYVFYNNPEFNRSIYSKQDMIELLKEKMG